MGTIIRAALSMAILFVGASPSAQNEQALGLTGGSWDGQSVIRTVDARRVIVAIDTTNEGRPADGLIDRVFLFTASEASQLPSVSFSGSVHLEYSGKMLTVVLNGAALAFQFVVTDGVADPMVTQANTIRFDRAIGLSQYTGWSGFRLGDLEHIRSGNCASCYIAGRHELHFPA